MRKSPAAAKPPTNRQLRAGELIRRALIEAFAEVTLNGDMVFEPDELVVLSFRNPTNATMGGFMVGFLSRCVSKPTRASPK